MKVTRKDIAKAAGVSQTAVSFALNGKKGISETTRHIILNTAEKLGYKSTSAVHKPNIALLFHTNWWDIDQAFYDELNRNCLIVAEQDYSLNLSIATVKQEGNSYVFTDNIENGTVDGIICYGDMERDILKALDDLSMPYVILDSSRDDPNRLAIKIDYKFAAYKATKYLISLGHRDIAYIGSQRKAVHDFNLLTFAGFQQALSEYNIMLNVNRIQLDVYNEESLNECINATLKGVSRPSAFFCSTDYYAILAIRNLRSKGIRVPEDISIISIDDISLARFTVPSLTTVKIDRYEIAKQGLFLINQKIQGIPCSSVTLKEYKLIVRESTAHYKRQSSA